MKEHSLTALDMLGILENIKFPNYRISVKKGIAGTLYLQAEYEEEDVVTGEMMTQKTRKWKLSQFMTKSELVQTAFKCVLTSAEHRVREHFLYKGHRVYSPHYDVEALVELCEKERFDERDFYQENGE